MDVWWVVLVTMGEPVMSAPLLVGQTMCRLPVALCESALAPTSFVSWEYLVLYSLPIGAGPEVAGVPLKGTHREPLILPGWIGCEPYPAVTERIEPGNKLLVVVVCICDVVASLYVSR